ncbi:MAG: DUF4922 domain-containing protein [Prevotellaceae bacterium]|jgi:ATP adenylyltransferase/5',5'''-P-1,P-4-tetraphosphate phosphorylase II|nr:DUF4922 domain-containing protein [Prevotellaceae bacterium]
MNALQSEIEKLYSEQLTEWEQFREQALRLNEVKIRTFNFGNPNTGKYVIKTQYNPARAVSSNAKLDGKSIAARKCFLCPENRPAVQREVRLNENFVALVNPFPVLKEHFTIPLIQHKKQEILPYLGDMLDFAQMLPGFTVFYNGPKAGASAPDHLHFQAVRKGQLPFEQEYQLFSSLNRTELYSIGCQSYTNTNKNGRICALQNYGRSCLLMQSPEKETAQRLFQQVYAQLQASTGAKEEPMMNVFTLFENNEWNLLVFPRKAHRPSCFFAKGNDFKMISPGAIDIAGVFVLPRKEDFDSVDEKIISDVLRQVSLV